MNNPEQVLLEKITSFKYDPLGFVNYAFPWGKENTDLQNFKGLKKWQVTELQRITKIIQSNRSRVTLGLPSQVIYLAVCSGRGNGKSALIAILNLWMMSCWIGTTCIITANTEPQLRSKTFAEMGKWQALMINSHWFDKSGLQIIPAKWFAVLLKEQLSIDNQYYYIQGQTWNKDNPDAFAGAHTQRGMMLTFDEASGIDDTIWDVSEGFFSDLSPIRIWVAMSNGRKSSGRFYDCFHKNKDMWLTTSIDVREVEGIDHSFADRIISKYGEDSNIARTEVRGLFPSSGTNQFISSLLMDEAIERELPTSNDEALILGVDVARYGDDSTVLKFRQGRDARSIPTQIYKGLDNYEVAREVVKNINQYNPDAVLVDGGGTGSGVVDILKHSGYRVIEVQFGSRPNKPEQYVDKRGEMWGDMRDWLETGCIDNNEALYSDLTSVSYEITQKYQVKLESKKDMKKRGVRSPDEGDALAITFAIPIAGRKILNGSLKKQKYAKMDYVVIE